MKTALPIYRCPIAGKHTKVVAVALLYGSHAPFQVCAAHLEHYRSHNWRFRVVMIDEYKKYPCFRKRPDFWCSEQYAHTCEPLPPAQAEVQFPELEPLDMRKSRGDIL